MEIKIGEQYYLGDGNSKFGNLALVEVIKRFKQNNRDFYEFKFIRNFASKWEGDIPEKNHTSITMTKYLKPSFKEAKKSFIQNMNLEGDKGIVKYIFE